MRLGIIAPIANTEFIAEHTDFDVALGYMTMRFERYLYLMQSLRGLGRPLYMIQQPQKIIRMDHYLMAARRASPTILASTPHFSADESYKDFTQLLQYKPRFEELSRTTIAPFITQNDNEHNIAVYGDIAPARFVSWSVAENVPPGFARRSIIVGMCSPEFLQKIKPVALITAAPILMAQMPGRTDMVLDDFLSPDWFFAPLSAEQLSVAVEEIKRLRNVVTTTEKKLAT